MEVLSRIIRYWLVPLGVVGLGVVGFLSLASMAEPPTQADTERLPPRVEIAFAESLPQNVFSIETNGVVVPRKEYRIAAAIQGRVAKKSPDCKSGREVKEGDFLLEIDKEPLLIEERSLLSEQAQVQADLEQLKVEIANNERLQEIARADLKLQKEEQERTLDAARTRAVSQTDLTQIRSQVIAAERALQTLENEEATFAPRKEKLQASLKLIESKLEKNRYDQARAEICSPCDGVIISDPFEVNGYARPGDVLVEIEDTSIVEVRANLRMEELYWLLGTPLTSQSMEAKTMLLPPAPATIRYRVGNEVVQWSGQLARFEGAGFDERTRTAPVRIEITDPLSLRDAFPSAAHSGTAGKLAGRPFRPRRGMFVSVTLEVPNPPAGLVQIPREALRPGETVWVVKEDKLHIVPVEALRFEDDRVIVRPLSLRDAFPSAAHSGIAGEGQLTTASPLVTSPLSVAEEGLTVRPKDPSKDNAEESR